MSVKIGHASVDENGKATGGKAGDQTKREVCIGAWYDGKWDYLLRPKTAELAEKSAQFMEEICKNDNIGYDQGQRNALYKEAVKVGFKASKLPPCECDCSAGVHTSAIAGGANLKYGSNGLTTRTMVKAFRESGDYEVIDIKQNPKYSTDDYLKRGDTLVKEGSHTLIVLEDGAKVAKKVIEVSIDPAKSFDRKLKGVYKTTSDLHLRSGAGSNKTSITIIPKGTKVECCGHYTEVSGTKWVFADVTINGVNYVGFSSSRYLKLS